MSQKNNKSIIFIVISIIVFIPNFAGLIVASFVLYSAPLILYIITGIMVIISIIGLVYGISLRKK